jgi:acyl-CoA thioester hydrolase
MSDSGNHAHSISLRVRYSETDQMGTFYNSRVLEWFECGRTEFLRAIGCAYADMENSGVMLPIVEAHANYLGRARYDDELRLTTKAELASKARLRFEEEVILATTGERIASGYTIHAFTNPEGRPIRPPGWLLEALERGPRSSE